MAQKVTTSPRGKGFDSKPTITTFKIICFCSIFLAFAGYARISDLKKLKEDGGLTDETPFYRLATIGTVDVPINPDGPLGVGSKMSDSMKSMLSEDYDMSASAPYMRKMIWTMTGSEMALTAGHVSNSYPAGIRLQRMSLSQFLRIAHADSSVTWATIGTEYRLRTGSIPSFLDYLRKQGRKDENIGGEIYDSVLVK